MLIESKADIRGLERNIASTSNCSRTWPAALKKVIELVVFCLYEEVSGLSVPYVRFR